MRFFVTKKVLVWVILRLSAVIYAIFLSSCFGAGVRPPNLGTGAAGVPGTTGGVLSRIALSVTALAGIALIGCAVVVWFAPNKFLIGKIAVACVAAIIGSQLLLWFGAHLGAISVVVLVVGVIALGWVAWRHLGKIEKRLGVDLNGDGKRG